jgi:HSP20 family protein
VARRRDIDRLQGELEELFSDLWQVPRFTGQRQGFRPHVDCFRTQDPPELTVVVELPGVARTDVTVVAAGTTLEIAGVRRRPEAAGRVYQQMEIEHGPFHRALSLGDDVDSAGATATMEHGLLTIVLPLAARRRPRGKVPIEVRAS